MPRHHAVVAHLHLKLWPTGSDASADDCFLLLLLFLFSSVLVCTIF